MWPAAGERGAGGKYALTHSLGRLRDTNRRSRGETGARPLMRGRALDEAATRA
ncbi:hypothetical protein BURPS1106B_A1143 [Burkholderia pseudomallei 1106b]|uniref:Uncharacterized protein n=1 Tax=Burkholderia pseudomallei (strain 1106a) TaxID=357348 RepID=A3NV00_BURP0|nr:hypothetical protein BURPS1106A_1906 [Burkholderia pseudomallei 1106a]EDS86785.1 hypothetical protein BURPSS13_P0539 [Burkholderia pseudomallei S13]EES26328.1 hypothetical protein BURPS1106B_A1143 [Burkholderia pseudomallei 1106b]